MHETLSTINANQQGNIVCLTIQKLKKFRNAGTWINSLKAKYEGYDNPTMAYLLNDVMQNYELIDLFSYNRGQENQRTVNMLTVVYKLKVNVPIIPCIDLLTY